MMMMGLTFVGAWHEGKDVHVTKLAMIFHVFSTIICSSDDLLLPCLGKGKLFQCPHTGNKLVE